MVVGALTEAGYEFVQSVVGRAVLDRLDGNLASLQFKGAGTRNLLDLSWCRELAQSLRDHPRIGEVLKDSDVAVQCTLFDKNQRRNWRVAFHQDLSVPVSCRIDHPDLTGWSEKEGQVF